MLTVRGLSISIEKAQILRRVGLHIPKGATAGLIGRNGAGKTTLMRGIMGLIPRDEGEIVFDGQDLTRIPAHRRAHLRIGYMPEDRRLVPEFTVEENILLPVWATRQAADARRVDWVYEMMPEIAQFRDRKALSLSGGQQKLVALGRAMICGSKLLLLDEPFEGVAPALAQRLQEVIDNLKGAGLSVLISESDYTHTVDLLDHLFVIERGALEERVVQAGETGKVQKGERP